MTATSAASFEELVTMLWPHAESAKYDKVVVDLGRAAAESAAHGVPWDRITQAAEAASRDAAWLDEGRVLIHQRLRELRYALRPAASTMRLYPPVSKPPWVAAGLTVPEWCEQCPDEARAFAEEQLGSDADAFLAGVAAGRVTSFQGFKFRLSVSKQRETHHA